MEYLHHRTAHGSGSFGQSKYRQCGHTLWPMHVALYTHSTVPVRGYGGTQRVVVWLARGLAELGHRVTLLALRGSRVPEAQLVALEPKQLRSRDYDISPHVPESADILHAHTPLNRPSTLPYVFTLHGNLREG